MRGIRPNRYIFREMPDPGPLQGRGKIYIHIIPKEKMMDEWVSAWLRREREKGVKCLEIKYISGKPYVYHSTSRYDRTTKSPRKVSSYIGRLTEEEGLIPKGAKKRQERKAVTWIVEPSDAPIQHIPLEADEGYPDATSPDEPLQEEEALLLSLKEAFPECGQEIYAALIPITGHKPPVTSKTESSGEGIRASPVPISGVPCQVRSLIGSNTGGQQAIFSFLSTGARRIAYPFTLAGTPTDPLRIYGAILIIEEDSGIPIMVQRLPEPPCDLSVVALTVLSVAMREEEPHEIILLINPEEMMQMGGCGDADCDELAPLQESGLPFIYPLPYESSRYDSPTYLTDHFTWGDRLILSGSDESGGLMTYLFKDVRSAGEEAEELNSSAEMGLIDRPTLRCQLRRAGRRLILSSMRVDAREIFDLASRVDQIHLSVGIIRELMERDLPMAASGEMDDGAITGSLFLSLLAANLSQTSKVGGGETENRIDAPEDPESGLL